MSSVTGPHPHHGAVAGPPAPVDPSREHSTSPGRRFALPDKPLVVIERKTPWASLDLRGLWAHRELFWYLTLRDLQVRYKQTVLGAAWAVLQPLLTMLVFAYVFGRLMQMPSDDIPYPVFAYTGLLTWTFFANAVTLASNSLAGNADLIAKVYFPRLVIPAASVAGSLVDFGIAAALLVPLMAYYGFTASWTLALVPGLMLLTSLLALGVGLWVSALTVRYRDVRYALPFVIHVWFFVTPIIYPSRLLPESSRWLLALNPLTGIIEGSRAALYGRPLEWPAVGLSALVCAALVVSGAVAFKRAEATFAELL